MRIVVEIDTGEVDGNEEHVSLLDHMEDIEELLHSGYYSVNSYYEANGSVDGR